MKRPLLRPLWNAGLAWLAVCLIGAWLPVQWLWPTAGVALLCFGVSCVIPAVRANAVWLLTAATVALALASLAHCETVRYRPLVEAEGQTVTLRAQVYHDDEATNLRVLFGDLPAGTRLRLWGEPAAMVLADYDVVEAAFEVQPVTARGLTLRQQKASGVWGAVVPAGALTVTGRAERTVWQQLTDWRDALALRIQTLLSGDSGAVVTGICLGVDESLSAEAEEAFRTCGVSHLFAVSGLHLSIVTQALLLLLKRWRVPRRVVGIVCIVAILAFSAIIGWTPSIARAGVMCLLVTAGVCLRRQADALSSLGLALLLLLVAEPFAAYDAGLLLSFLATFGLLFVSPRMNAALLRVPFKGIPAMVWAKVAGVVAVAVSATFATLPVMVLYFGSVSLVGVLANLLMTTVASVLLILGWLAIVFLAVGLVFLYRPLLLLAGSLARALLWLAKRLAALPLASVSVRTPYLIVWLIGGVLLFTIGYVLLNRRGLQLAAITAALAVCVGGAVYQGARRDTVCVGVLEMSSGWAACIRYRATTVLMLTPDNTAMLTELPEALRREGIRSLHAVFVIDGDAATAAHLPTALGTYVSPSRLYGTIAEPVSLWEGASVFPQGVNTVLDTGACRLVFGEDVGANDAACYISVERITIDGCTLAQQNGAWPWLYITDGTVQVR